MPLCSNDSIDKYVSMCCSTHAQGKCINFCLCPKTKNKKEQSLELKQKEKGFAKHIPLAQSWAQALANILAKVKLADRSNG